MDKLTIQQEMATGDDLIGVMVYWTELHGVKVARAAFRDGFRRCGFGGALAEEPKPEKVLNRAVVDANRRVHVEDGSKTKPVRAQLKRKDDDATYAVMVRRDLGDRMAFVEEGTVSLPRKGPVGIRPVYEPNTNAPASDDARDDLAASIVAEYIEQSTTANTVEISEAMVRAVREVCSGLTLRGGLYIVRPDHLAALVDLQKFLANAGINLELWEIKASTRNADTAQRNAEEALRSQFTELMTDINAFRADHATTAVADIPERSIVARAERFRHLDALVDLYADVLRERAETLSVAIAHAKQEFLDAYLGESTDAAA